MGSGQTNVCASSVSDGLPGAYEPARKSPKTDPMAREQLGSLSQPVSLNALLLAITFCYVQLLD